MCSARRCFVADGPYQERLSCLCSARRYFVVGGPYQERLSCLCSARRCFVGQRPGLAEVDQFDCDSSRSRLESAAQEEAGLVEIKYKYFHDCFMKTPRHSNRKIFVSPFGIISVSFFSFRTILRSTDVTKGQIFEKMDVRYEECRSSSRAL